MKSVKKTLAVVVVAFQTLSLTAGAATIDSLQYSAGNVTVRGTSEEKTVTYKVYDKDASGTSIADVCEMGEAKVTGGEFEIKIKMPKAIRGEETDGEYVFAVMGNKQDTEDFEVIAYSSMKAFVDAVNGAGISSGADLVTLFAGNADAGYTNLEIMESLGADIKYYTDLEETRVEFANAFFTENGEKKVTVEEFAKLFENAKVVQYINKNQVSEEWLAESGFEFEGESFGDIEDSKLKTWILDKMNGVFEDSGKFASYSDIENKYLEANVIYFINNAKHTEYEEKITEYSDALGLTDESYFKDYLDMKDNYKNMVNSNVKNLVASSSVTDAEDFKARFEAEVKKVKQQIARDTAANKPSTGGGGGGSSAGGMSIITQEPSNPTKEQSKFGDLVNVDWAKTAIEALAAKGVVAGYDDNTFKPQKNITREEFIKMVVAAQGVRLNTSPCGLTDVDQNAWYAPYVNAAYASGIIKGVSETQFGIGQEITREDMAVIIARLKNYQNAEAANAFADDAGISAYAKDAVYSLYNAGKIAGVGNNMFGPKQIVNRAQAAKIIYDTLFAGM